VTRARRRAWPGRIGSRRGLVLVTVVEIALLSAEVGAAAPPRRSPDLSSGASEPQARRRVLLLVDGPRDPFMARVQAEVASLGLQVVLRAPFGPIETSARAEHAVAAIRVLPSRNGVEVWMADETSGRSLLRQAIVDETPGGPNQNLIALQTAELLRTSLFPHRPGEAPPALRTPPPPPPAPSATSESGLVTGVGLLYGAGGAGPAWQAAISFQHFWARGLGFSLNLGVPIDRGAMTAREGTAEVGAILAGAEVLARFRSERRRLFLITGLGAAFASVWATGHPIPEASAQLVSHSSNTSTGVGYARITLGFKPSSWLGLGVSGLAGATSGKVHVRFAGSEAGDWGVLIVGANLFGEVDWN